MIPSTHAVVTERMGFMARLPPAGVILQATAALGQANQMKLICTLRHRGRAFTGKFPSFAAINVTSVVPDVKSISQTTCTLSLSFAFEEGPKLLCACRIVMVPTDSQLALVCS